MKSTDSASVQPLLHGKSPNASSGRSTQSIDGNLQACVIAVASGKGGVGKTCISTNLSISLASQGKKVCLFDADTSLANVNIVLNLSPKRTLEQYISNECPIDDILIEAPGGIQIVPGATGIGDFVQLSTEQQNHLISGLKQLESQFDYLVIDTGAGISDSLIQFLLAAPYMIITITQEPTSLTDAFSLLKVLKRAKFNAPVFAIVNMAQDIASAHETYYRFKKAVKKYLELNIYYLGFIFSDPKVPASIRAQKPFLLKYPDSLASRCLKNTTLRLTQALDKKRSENAFSDYFQTLTPDKNDDELTLIAADESANATEENNQPPVPEEEQSPDKTLELLLSPLRKYCQTHPEAAVNLQAPMMQLLGMNPESIEPNKNIPLPFEHTKNNVTPPLTNLAAKSFNPEDSQSQALWSACLFASQLGSVSN